MKPIDLLIITALNTRSSVAANNITEYSIIPTVRITFFSTLLLRGTTILWARSTVLPNRRKPWLMSEYRILMRVLTHWHTVSQVRGERLRVQKNTVSKKSRPQHVKLINYWVQYKYRLKRRTSFNDGVLCAHKNYGCIFFDTYLESQQKQPRASDLSAVLSIAVSCLVLGVVDPTGDFNNK